MLKACKVRFQFKKLLLEMKSSSDEAPFELHPIIEAVSLAAEETRGSQKSYFLCWEEERWMQTSAVTTTTLMAPTETRMMTSR